VICLGCAFVTSWKVEIGGARIRFNGDCQQLIRAVRGILNTTGLIICSKTIKPVHFASVIPAVFGGNPGFDQQDRLSMDWMPDYNTRA
jgi:hypothetical protein